MPVLEIDTRQQAGKHVHKDEWFAAHGVETVHHALKTGDYSVEGSNVLVDTKRNVAEVAQNINGKNHQRFREECKRARNAGCRLVVLVENLNGYERVAHVAAWENDHCTRCRLRRQKACDPRDPQGKCMRHRTMKPIQGPRLARAMQTMEQRYGVRFEFCHPRDAARRICELLGVDYDD